MNGPDPDKLESIELARRAQEGDDLALEALLERHYPRVLALVRAGLDRKLRRRVGSMDVVQSVMRRAIRTFDRFELRSEDAFSRWIATIVRNGLTDIARFQHAACRDPEREQPIDALEQPAVANSSESPIDALSRREELDLLEEAMGTLSPRARAVVELERIGCSWSDIATQVGLSSSDAARMSHKRSTVMMAAWIRRKRRR